MSRGPHQAGSGIDFESVVFSSCQISSSPINNNIIFFMLLSLWVKSLEGASCEVLFCR